MVLHPNFLYWSDKAIVFPREEHIMTVSMQLTRSRSKNFQTIPLSISLFFVFFSIHIQKMFLFFTFFVLFFLLFLQWRRWWKEKTSHYSPRYSGLCGENDRSLDWEFWWKMVIWFTFVAIKSVVFSHKAFCTLCLKKKINFCLNYRPFWLSPTQAIVIPVSPKYEEYANKVCVLSSVFLEVSYGI